MRTSIDLRTIIARMVIFAFLANTLGPIPTSEAQEIRLPAPGTMVPLSPEFNPPVLKGLKVHPDNPFRFDFILDTGDDASLRGAQATRQSFIRGESTKLIKYFLASLTIPEKDLWVNLSPYEKDRIIPQSFGLTEMGRDLLAEDYLLKQITASLIYPEDSTGKKFWKRVYEETSKKFGTTNIPINTFNKVWIVPEKAVVYENAKAGTAYVVESKLKVMLEQDYLSLSHHAIIRNDTGSIGANIVREVVIPELTKEVNEGKNFSQLRQVYNSLILATWYKKKIKDSILEEVYADKNKTAGVGYQNLSPSAIYQRYLEAFRKGAYNYIKEETDPITQQNVPRKYFSGGVSFFGDMAMTTVHDPAVLGVDTGRNVVVSSQIENIADSAMAGTDGVLGDAMQDNRIVKLIEYLKSRGKRFYLSELLVWMIRLGYEVPAANKKTYSSLNQGTRSMILGFNGNSFKTPQEQADIEKILTSPAEKVTAVDLREQESSTAAEKVTAVDSREQESSTAAEKVTAVDSREHRTKTAESETRPAVLLENVDQELLRRLQVELEAKGYRVFLATGLRKIRSALNTNPEIRMVAPTGEIPQEILGDRSYLDISRFLDAHEHMGKGGLNGFLKNVQEQLPLGQAKAGGLRRYGFDMDLVKASPKDVLKKGQGVVNVGIEIPNRDVLALARKASFDPRINVIIALRSSGLVTREDNLHYKAWIKSGIIFKEGIPYSVSFTHPLPLDYVVFSRPLMSYPASSAYPVAGHWMSEVFLGQKDITHRILEQAGVRQPKMMPLMINYNRDIRTYTGIQRAHDQDLVDFSAYKADEGNEPVVKGLIRQALDDFLKINHFQEAVMKPNDGLGGMDVMFYREHNIDQAVDHVWDLFSKGKNVVVQERIVPPFLVEDPAKVFDWNVRVFVSMDEQGRPKVSDMVARVGPEGKAVNIHQGATYMLLEDVARRLGLRAKGLERLKTDISYQCQLAFEAINREMREKENVLLQKYETGSDFMGMDVMVRREGKALVPYVIEANGYNAGGGFSLDDLVEKTDPQRVGRWASDFIETMIRRGREYQRQTADRAMSSAAKNENAATIFKYKVKDTTHLNLQRKPGNGVYSIEIIWRAGTVERDLDDRNLPGIATTDKEASNGEILPVLRWPGDIISSNFLKNTFRWQITLPSGQKFPINLGQVEEIKLRDAAMFVKSEGAKALETHLQQLVSRGKKKINMTQPKIGKKFRLSAPRVSQILDKYGVKSKGSLTDGFKYFMIYVERNSGRDVPESAVELRDEYGVSLDTVYTKARENKIVLADLATSRGAHILHQWARENEGKTINASRWEVSDLVGLSIRRVVEILGSYHITLLGNWSADTKRLETDAKSYSGQTIQGSKKLLAEWYGISRKTVKRVIDKEQITLVPIDETGQLKKWEFKNDLYEDPLASLKELLKDKKEGIFVDPFQEGRSWAGYLNIPSGLKVTDTGEPLAVWFDIDLLKRNEKYLKMIYEKGELYFSYKTRKYLENFPSLPLDPEIFAEIRAFVKGKDQHKQVLMVAGKEIANPTYRHLSIMLERTLWQMAGLADTEEGQELEKYYISAVSDKGLKKIGRRDILISKDRGTFFSRLRKDDGLKRSYLKLAQAAWRWMYYDSLYNVNFSSQEMMVKLDEIYWLVLPFHQAMENRNDDLENDERQEYYLANFILRGMREFMPYEISGGLMNGYELPATGQRLNQLFALTKVSQFLSMFNGKPEKQLTQWHINLVYQALSAAASQGPKMGDRAKELWAELREQLQRRGIGETEQKNGGIDLTPANMNLQTKGEESIQFHMDPAQLAQLQDAPGLVPVIINIRPMSNLREFLGT